MSKKSFEEIREKVERTYEPLQNIDHAYLNERGKLVYEVYDILDDCLCFADDLETFVANVRQNIEDMLKPVWYRSYELEEQYKLVAEKLRRFVRWNIENELWENIPEFANRKEN